MVDRLLRSRAWIWLVGILLGGIVAMQVSLLKLNTGISRAVEASATLQRQNADLEGDIARLSSSERTRTQAESQGMIMPPAGEVSYLTARADTDASRAVARMRPPSDAARQLLANRGITPGSLAAGPSGAGTSGGPASTSPGSSVAGANGAGSTGSGSSPDGAAGTGTSPAATGTGASGAGTSAGGPAGDGPSGASTVAGGAPAGGATGTGTSGASGTTSPTATAGGATAGQG